MRGGSCTGNSQVCFGVGWMGRGMCLCFEGRCVYASPMVEI